MIVDGFFNAIHASLNYILENTDTKTNVLAIFEAKLELQAPDMVFIPSLDYVSGSYGFYDMVESIVSDIYSMATLVARLADHNESSHYQVQFRRTKG
jgi:dynein heavy chain